MNKNRITFIVNLMKKQIIDFLNGQVPFGDLVDGLDSLMEDFESKEYNDFLDAWFGLENVYASVHYVRDYYTMEEIAITCKSLIKFTQLIFAFEQEHLKDFIPTEDDLEEDIYPPVHIPTNSLVMDQRDSIIALLENINSLCRENIQNQEHYSEEQLAKICKSVVLVGLSV